MASPGSSVSLQFSSGRPRERLLHSTAMPLDRQWIIHVLSGLPPGRKVDDAVERLVFLAKVEEGVAQLDRGEGIPHDEVERRLLS